MGAPTLYTKQLADLICRLIATEPHGLDWIIEKYSLGVDRASIYNWLQVYPDFFDKYIIARKMQAHIFYDEAIEIPDKIDTYNDKDGNERIDAGILGRGKLKMDMLKWAAERLAPKHYDRRIEKETQEDDTLLAEAKKRKQELDESNKKEY